MSLRGFNFAVIYSDYLFKIIPNYSHLKEILKYLKYCLIKYLSINSFDCKSFFVFVKQSTG